MRAVFTLENLDESSTSEKPPRLAVLGYPVAHSASPQLHQPALDAMGIAASYIRLEVMPGDIPRAFHELAKRGFIGCNVTVPHKLEAIEACAWVDPDAITLGAVNTVLFKDGRPQGFNTDGPGFEMAIEEEFGLQLGATHCIILGAGGGAGQAIATQCALSKPSVLSLVNRSEDKLVALSRRLAAISPQTEIRILTFDSHDLRDRCHDAELLIQTTSLGLKKSDPPIIPSDFLLPAHCVYDTIYQPPATPLLTAASAKGCRVGNGLSLLLHQGAIAFKIWFPGTNPLPHMRASRLH